MPCELPRREYRSGVELSVVGFGGIVVIGMDQTDADRAVAEAVEYGVNYFDVAPSYGKGEAEEKLGLALQPYRDEVFLACKTHARDAKGAAEHLEASMRRLRTDHFDLYQFHGLQNVEEVEQILSPGGAAEVALRAREQGKVRYLGFSSHSEEAALKIMDEIELDSILMPLNFACWMHGGFGERAFGEARKRGLASLALKAMALRPWSEGEKRGDYPKCWYKPVTDPQLQELALRFTLSKPVVAAVSPGHVELLRRMIEIARNFTPLTGPELANLRDRAAEIEPIFSASRA